MALKAINGLPVMDAKKAMVVHINENDIAKADRKEPMDCAVARAVRREFHAQEARIHLGRVYVRANKGNWTRYMTPRPLRAEIIAFDRGGTFEPGTFTLAAPSANKRASGKQQGTANRFKKKNRPGQVKRQRHIVANVRSGPA